MTETLPLWALGIAIVLTTIMAWAIISLVRYLRDEKEAGLGREFE